MTSPAVVKKDTLSEIKQRFIDCASGLGDYESINKTDLANGYCDAEEAGDETKRSQYYSALMLRYWYKIYEYARTCASMKLPIEDFVSWLDDSFYWAFRYKRWRDPNDKLYGDPNGPDKVFNRCFFSTRGRYYQHSNKEIRKLNWTTSSLDAISEEVGDHQNLLGVDDEYLPEKEIIEKLLKDKRFLEAIVLDGIFYQDVFEEIKTKKTMTITTYNEETEEEETEEEDYNSYSHEFNIKRLVKYIRAVNSDFTDYFVDYYDLDNETAEQFKEKITSLRPAAISKIVQRTLYNLARDKDILNLLGVKACS